MSWLMRSLGHALGRSSWQVLPCGNRPIGWPELRRTYYLEQRNHSNNIQEHLRTGIWHRISQNHTPKNSSHLFHLVLVPCNLFHAPLQALIKKLDMRRAGLCAMARVRGRHVRIGGIRFEYSIQYQLIAMVYDFDTCASDSDVRPIWAPNIVTKRLLQHQRHSDLGGIDLDL